MELFGLILAIPFTLLSSTVFCFLGLWAFRRFPMLQPPIVVIASAVLCSIILEFVLLLSFGPLALHHRFHGVYSTLHLVHVVVAPPALGCMVLIMGLRRGIRMIPLCGVVICVCWMACMVSLLGNIVVNEAIYGVEGSNREGASQALSP